MVIQALRDKFAGRLKPEGPKTDEKPEATSPKLKTAEATAPVSRAAKKEVSKPEKPVIQLNIGPHEHITDKASVKNKSALKILSFYQHGAEVKNKAGENEKTEAFFSAKQDELLVHIPASIAAEKLANSSVFKRLTSMFSSFKVNDALTRLKEGTEIDLISEGNEPTSPGKLRELTRAGVYSFVAVHQANDKGDFAPKADLLVPVMDLHALLEHLKANVPKGIAKEFHAQFKADVEKLEANPRLKNVMFIDEALALKANKDKYSSETELRKALCCVTDVLSLNSEVLVSSDLIGKGEEAQARGKEYSAFDFQYPVISKQGAVSIVEHPMTLVRNETRKTEELPVEQLNRVLQWHFMSQLTNPEKVGSHKEVLPMLGKAFEANAGALNKFNVDHGTDTKKADPALAA
jgi:hypothetical protein